MAFIILTVALLIRERCRFERDVGELLADTSPSLPPHTAEYFTLLHGHLQTAVAQIRKYSGDLVRFYIGSLQSNVQSLLATASRYRKNTSAACVSEY